MAATKVSPLAPERFPEMPVVYGVRLATRACGLRYVGRDDVLFVEMDEGTTVAGVFTRSTTAAPPVDWCRNALAGGQGRALVVNAGNANAFTGEEGLRTVERSVRAAAELLDCRPSRVFVASTGVIGERLDDTKITGALSAMKNDLAPGNWEAAARAIGTTDTFPKGATRSVTLGGVEVTVAGIAKGSGMIAPNMATMLAFVFTDAAVPAPILQAVLEDANERSFNRTTVDGDTSTSDTLLLFATGRAGNIPLIGPDDPDFDVFRAAVREVCLDLAHQVVRDGEGASKFVTITVTGAEDSGAAKRIGLAVADSPLVKTAIAGEDANWGRIVMAVGKSGEEASREDMAIRIGGHAVAEQGSAVPGYDEGPIAAHMRGAEIDIAIDVGVGDGEATVWTCDLTHGYIDINADYRT